MTNKGGHDPVGHLAWLMWCYGQGYTHAEDRAILTNWMRDDPATLTSDDLTERARLLEMAGEVLLTLQTDSVTATVAETLRYVSRWLNDADGDNLREVADGCERDLSWCCPVCQEIECDSDCPLRNVRASQ